MAGSSSTSGAESIIEILDAGTIGRIDTGAATDSSARYVTALVKAGASFYVDNADVEMRALVVDGRVLPLVINDGVGGANSNVCSPYAHYVAYRREALTRLYGRTPWSLSATQLMAARVLKFGQVDRAVFVNNWLLTTNPTPGLTTCQIGALTRRLTAAFPRSAIVFRSVNPAFDHSGFEALRQSRYRFVRSRSVYLFDPVASRYLDRHNARQDRRLLQTTPYAIRGSAASIAPHAPRVAALYRDLYLHKYSQLNPQFNARLISLTLGENVFTYRAFERNGRVDAFYAFLTQDNVMTGSILGYDRQLPQALGLYRLCFAGLMAEAEEHGALMNLSAGAGGFKMLRGCVPVDEYDAVYDHHLPAYRRLAWTLLQAPWRYARRPMLP